MTPLQQPRYRFRIIDTLAYTFRLRPLSFETKVSDRLSSGSVRSFVPLTSEGIMLIFQGVPGARSRNIAGGRRSGSKGISIVRHYPRNNSSRLAGIDVTRNYVANTVHTSGAPTEYQE